MLQTGREPASVRSNAHVRHPPPRATRRPPPAARCLLPARRRRRRPLLLPSTHPHPPLLPPSDRGPRLCTYARSAARIAGRFYECTVAGGWKEKFRGIIRDNRAKHARWRLGPSCSQNRLVLAAVKNWFAPTSHEINKQWAGRNRAGWTSADRVQCEACRKWRRLPEGVDGWPRDFYCQHGALWDPRRARCDAPEEEWQRDLPTTGDIVVYQVGGAT